MEYMPAFRLHRPASVEEAVALAAGDPAVRFLAGGTDMVVNIRRGIERPTALVDLSAIPELGAIDIDSGALRIGAAVTLARLAADPRVAAVWTAVAEAAGSVAGPTHRAYGTVGGNLCLDTRCLYYNQSEWWRSSNDYCLKHRGSVCHVAPGGKQCFAVFSGDLTPGLLIHDATVDLVGPGGRRTIPLGDLYRDDGMDHLALAAGEMVAAVRVPAPPRGARSGYLKSRVRGSIDFPLAGVAALVVSSDGLATDIRVAVTGVNPRPHRIRGIDVHRGHALDDNALDAIREAVRTQAKPMKTTTVAPWYRRRVVGALARRLVARLASS
ncbi:MAG: 4-hydroxybenzoyl-CoA reductase subunit beta [Alphaproteobacteria bacterium]|nr:4-hydroxybenzoyl-CoA reductase subunit beta [Alphaproteobacteria bacterium]